MKPLPRACLLLLATLVAVTVIFSTRLTDRISTDVTDLVSGANQDLSIKILSKFRQEGSRILLIRIDGETGQRKAAARELESRLKKLVEFRAVGMGLSPSSPGKIEEILIEERFTLLLPDFLADSVSDGDSPEQVANRAVPDLEEFLSSPESLTFEEMLPRDPLLLVPNALLKLKGPASQSEEELVWAEFSESVFDHDFRGAALGKVDSIIAGIGERYPDVEFTVSGSALFSEANVASSRAEVLRINLIVLGGVIVLAWVSLPHPSAIVHLLVLVALAFLGGTAAVAALFQHPHVLTFVIGSALTGICVDYGLHLLIHNSQSSDPTFLETLRKIRGPLLGGGISTITGSLLLCFSEVSLLQEIGVFVGVGLASALAVCWLYFPLFRPPSNKRTPLILRIPRFLVLYSGAFSLIALTALTALSLYGLFHLRWHDDVRQLAKPQPSLEKDDDYAREALGVSKGDFFYLIYGEDINEVARQRSRILERVENRSSEIAFSQQFFLPDSESLLLAKNFVESNGAKFSESFRMALDQNSFEVTTFDPFFEEWSAMTETLDFSDRDVAQATQRIDQVVDGPLAAGFHQGSSYAWSPLRTSAPVQTEPGDKIVTADQDESINQILALYRNAFLSFAVPALILITILLGIIFRKTGLVSAIISFASVILSLGLVQVFYGGVNLFGVVGAFIGFCLALDYTLFSRLTPEPGKRLPSSVTVSAITSVLSFSILCTSDIVAVGFLGLSATGSILFSTLFLVSSNRKHLNIS